MHKEEIEQEQVEENISAPDTMENEAVEEADAETDAETKDAQDRKKKIRGIITEALIYIAIIIVCVTVVPRYVVQRTIVDGDSMMDTLQDTDNLLVEKMSYRFHDPKRFDVIVFYPYGRDNPEYYIKRVIGLPGETVQIIGSKIYIDGKELKENYGKDPIDYAGTVEEPQKLGKDEFFVLGDNREVSQDSRYEDVGFVKRKNIEGKAILRIYPFSEFGTFR